MPGFDAGIPKWPKGADCKSAGNAFGGSNPSPGTRVEPLVRPYYGSRITYYDSRLDRGPEAVESRRVGVRSALYVRCRKAPLAQLAERLHGKEEVSGSNPEGGSETG
jgi:hypothetical protein